MDLEEKQIRKIYVYRGRILNVRNDDAQLSNGKIVSREVVEHIGGVCVLPVTENGDVIFVKQYRYPYEETILELPAGKLDPGEEPFHGAVRELHEETGVVGDTYYELGADYPIPGYTDEVIHLYAATGLKDVGQKLDEDEFLDVVKIPYEKALEMCYTGELTDSKTLILLLKYKLMEQSGRLTPMEESK